MRILVTGAAGFIGSVVTERLVEQGYDVVAMDNLSHGHPAAVDPKARFEQGDLLDVAWLRALFAGQSIDAVVHLAALALIDESIRNPSRFYRVNMVGGLNLLDAMIEAGVRRIVFSSTAAVYGEPRRTPVTEDDPLVPVNSYGQSKLAFEQALPWYAKAYGLRHVSFRYFNACGATPRCGEYRRKETHIIPLLFEAALGQKKTFHVFGTDYDTPDGTCIRDYIHVADIARAHVLALERIDGLQTPAYNLGNGNGFSNMEVVEAVRQVTGREIPVVAAARRPGDPARLVAGSQRACQQLGWKPECPDLPTMIRTAWDWRLKRPKGYEA